MSNDRNPRWARNIESVFKKLNIFTIDDLEMLTEKTKLEIIPVLERYIDKNKLKQENETYTYISTPTTTTKSKNVKERNPAYEMHTLPFKVVRPRTTFVKNLNELDGFVDYFFATPTTKKKIKNIFKVLKQTQNYGEKRLLQVLKKNDLTIEKYNYYKEEISKNGLVNLVGDSTKEPGEIYYFFKEYYLSPKGLSLDEARELGIKRFENLIKIHLNRGKITSSKTMYRWLLEEYSETQIVKYRMLNFSKFDMGSIEYEDKRV